MLNYIIFRSIMLPNNATYITYFFMISRTDRLKLCYMLVKAI